MPFTYNNNTIDNPNNTNYYTILSRKNIKRKKRNAKKNEQRGKKLLQLYSLVEFLKTAEKKHYVFSLQHMLSIRGNKEKMRLIIESFYSSLRMLVYMTFQVEYYLEIFFNFKMQ